MSNQKSPLVSIVILTYNSAQFIRAAIESVLAQDYPHIEIIISDDASTDNTMQIIKQYSDLHPQKIRLFTSEKNFGIAKNWFNALSHCRGEYISGLAGDDTMLPNKISKQVSVMESDSLITMCYSDATVVNASTQKMLYRLSDKCPSQSGGIKIALSNSIYYSPTILFRRKFLPKKNLFVNIRHTTDLAFYKEVMILSAPHGKIHYIPEVLCVYNKHEHNLTVVTKTYYKEHIEAIKILQKEYPQYKKDLAPSIYDFCCVAFFKTLTECDLKQTIYFLSSGLKASHGNCFKFLRATMWGLQFYFKLIQRKYAK